MKRDRAETIAIKALTFIAGDQDLMGAFLAQSGLSPDELRESLNEPGFLIGVLDFLLMEDERVLAFCARATESGSAYGRPPRAAGR